MRFFLTAAVCMLAIVMGSGCGSGGKPALNSPSNDEKPHATDDKHGHGGKAGSGHSHEAQHGGIVQSVGDYHLEMTHEAKNGELSLYILGSDEKTAYAIESKPFTAQFKLEGQDDFDEVEMNPIPLAGEQKGRSSRFAGTESRLAQVKSFEAIVRVPIEGKIFRATFQFAPGIQQSVYVCPMGCEKDKVYYKPGHCPACKMDLTEPKSAHADHAPKHGGIFFMAPNRWHHLEGVMASEREFRLYMYNNFTKPIPAQPFLEGSFIEVMNLDANRREFGKPARLTFEKAEEAYLRAVLPEGFKFPLNVNARVKFEGQEKPLLFNFTFDAPSHGEHHKENDGRQAK